MVIFYYLLYGMYMLAIATFLALLFVNAPYGRHFSQNWGPVYNSRECWILMESPSVWFFSFAFSRGCNSQDFVPVFLLSVFLFHYIHRVLIFPFRMRGTGKPMPLLVAALAFLFNIYNSFLQGTQISSIGEYPIIWFRDPRFSLGLLTFIAGFSINVWADSVLFSLRKDSSDKSYKVPTGFLYEYISSPNYFGEMIEWLGWAIMTWSLSGLAFFLYTVANLAPRAISHHRWYLQKFEGYPSKRKAFIPFLI